MRIESAALRVGTALVVLAALVALSAPWLAPFDPAAQLDPAHARLLPPLSRRQAVDLVDGQRLLARRIERRGDRLLLTDRTPVESIDLSRVVPQPDGRPTRTCFFLLGTDHLGRDVWSRLVWASRASLFVGILAVGLALTLGIAVGSAAAMLGGWADAVLMRSVDALLALPRLFLILLVTSLTRPDPLVVVLVLGCTAWMPVSRLARAQILALRSSDLELGARATGRHPLGIFWRHLLPNSLTPLLVDTSLRIGDLVLVEAALSFLGLGIQPPVPSWGNMIADGAHLLRSAWWVAAPAAVATTSTVLGFQLLGDGLRDRLDPRWVTDRT